MTPDRASAVPFEWMKKGYLSSEFGLLLLVIIVTNIQASGLIEPTHWSMKIATVIVNVLGLLGYTAARAKLKVAALEIGLPATDPKS